MMMVVVVVTTVVIMMMMVMSKSIVLRSFTGHMFVNLFILSFDTCMLLYRVHYFQGVQRGDGKSHLSLAKLVSGKAEYSANCI